MEKREILFSCAGTTDPVRGLRDGGLMHIARHYRPDKICMFLSAGMEKNIPLYDRMTEVMREKWGYAPEIRMVKSGIKDPSNLDELDGPMQAAFQEFADENPDAKILINLSSGTPQMEIILSQLALSPRYGVKGIQVKNPERQAGTTERVNSQRYNAEEELANNLDEDPKAENRCVEPGLFPIKRERAWQTVRKLLERGDYAAVLDRADADLPAPLTAVVSHLHLRDLLQDKEARNTVAGLPEEIQQAIPFYPEKPVGGYAPPNYWDVVNYWLMMKNGLRAQRYSEFLLRLEVLAVYLEEEQLKKLLTEQGYHDVTYSKGERGDRILSMDALNERYPEIYKNLCDRISKMSKDSSKKPENGRSVFLFTTLLLDMMDEGNMKEFFKRCDAITPSRNNVAHRLKAVTKDAFGKEIALSGMKKKSFDEKLTAFLQRVEETIQAIYPQCDPAVFDLHDKCVEYIERNR